MNLTPTEIQAIADRHLNAWFALDPRSEHPTLRDHVERAIGEALEKQAALYADGTETLRHERDEALKSASSEDAARLVERMISDYDAEHGHTDPDTGTREYPKGGDEYLSMLDDIIEGIRKLRKP